MVFAQVCPGGGSTLSSRTGPVTTGTLCGSSRRSRLAGSMTSGTPHRWVRGEGLGIPPLLGCHLGRGSRAPVVVGARVCISVCVFASALRVGVWLRLWARIALGSPWFWCSCSLPCASVCGYFHMGKGCLLSVVLVLGCMCAAMSSVVKVVLSMCFRFCVGQRYADEGNTLSITSSTQTLLGVFDVVRW